MELADSSPCRLIEEKGPTVCSIESLFQNNQAWSARCVAQDAQYFQRLARQQSPRYLWIGCSDSRVPANEILGLRPGEVFVHRNVGNLVVHSDLNCLTALQYAVEVLKVEHVLVVGHFGCGGVQAVVEQRRTGLAENWLRHLEDVARKHADRLDDIDDLEMRASRLCELNVIEQVSNVCRTTTVRRAWERGQHVEVHGLVYGLGDGLLRRVGASVGGIGARESGYVEALSALGVP
ncbi:MAG: carbonate dehydratase [Variovorax paradoxus]|nr:MAG: carbonate dehydratase [Variovorax paradoxus]PZQ03624.1 MAG: carbonate dehydratase [Variovorax paradoxus]